MNKYHQKAQEDVHIIRKADLENHNKDGGLWIVIHGKVYDVHSFKSQAPCGEDMLLQYAGRDASAMFENVHHTLAARDMMQQFYVGQFVEVNSSHFWGGGRNITWICILTLSITSLQKYSFVIRPSKTGRIMLVHMCQP